MKSLLDFVNEADSLGARDGKPAKKSKDGNIEWGVNEPVDNSASDHYKWDKTLLNKNQKRLLAKFKAKEDFFVMGEAGWGKTSIIENLAKQFGLEVITVYLDKAEATDLGGIPVPMEDKKRGAKQKTLSPEWAEPIFEAKENGDKTQFLLFFDEMNQAAPDVMNALMPIVLKHEICGTAFDNFFVGAAGNFDYENGAVSELSGPLKSRFKPLIVWETGEAQWKETFRFLHKEWDNKIGVKLMDILEKNCELFVNPRELEHKVIKWVYKIKDDGDVDIFDVEDILDRIEGLVKEDLSRTQIQEIKKLAEDIHKYLNGKFEEKSETTGGRRKGSNMVDQTIIDAIKQSMELGYLQPAGTTDRYGVSKENISSIVDEEDCNAEMLERIISKFEADGIKWRFTKDKQWRDEGYLDPNEE